MMYPVDDLSVDVIAEAHTAFVDKLNERMSGMDLSKYDATMLAMSAASACVQAVVDSFVKRGISPDILLEGMLKHLCHQYGCRVIHSIYKSSGKLN